ncbi:MAG: PD40 domain-containing protein [Gemmatimonadetes bacterium]|nr:PD40 domain-containing protein [Gemmatimonadota bacterium]
MSRYAIRALALAAVLLVAPLAFLADSAGLSAQEPTGRENGKGSEEKDLPLEPGRKLAFTASEGTWMSLDVSPDGSTLVFDLLGDLYTLPIDGGQATRLTSGMAHDVQPRFSPDGSRVVFISDRSGSENLWIISLDRADTVALTEEKTGDFLSPEWTPDGRYIVASKGRRNLKLWLYHVDGGSGTELHDGGNEQSHMAGAAFGADGQHVWYASRNGRHQYNAVFPLYQLSVYDRKTGTATTMTSRYGSAVRPTLSPDGRWLVYGTRHRGETGLRLRELDSGNERWLAYPVQRDDQESVAPMDALPGFSFTPDSRSLIASYGGKDSITGAKHPSRAMVSCRRWRPYSV